MPERESDPRIPPQVEDRRIRPSGVLPRNTQAWVVSGLALVMIVIIAISGHNPPKEKPPALEPPPTETDAARIQEYEAHLKEETERLETAKAQLAHTQKALGFETGVPSAPPVSGPAATFALGLQPTSDSLDRDHSKREQESLFASNVALTFRKEASVGAASSPATPADIVAKALANYAPTARSEGSSASSGSVTQEDPVAKREAETPTKAARDAERDTEIDRADGHTYRLFEGTVFETVLTNRLDGSFSGPVNCMLTTSVYSRNGLHLLIPQGARLLGDVRKVESFGEERLAVTFHRLIMPDGYSVSLDRMLGLNQIGETGLQDQINHHYLQVFGVSLAIGAIAGLSQANTAYGANESASDAYRQGMASSLSQSSVHILDRYLNVLPTITIREGHRVKVYLSDDLLLPAYDHHRMPGDL